ncbi:Down syndrome critical region protein 9 [Bienertia sinuspersici]
MVSSWFVRPIGLASLATFNQGNLRLGRRFGRGYGALTGLQSSAVSYGGPVKEAFLLWNASTVDMLFSTPVVRLLWVVNRVEKYEFCAFSTLMWQLGTVEMLIFFSNITQMLCKLLLDTQGWLRIIVVPPTLGLIKVNTDAHVCEGNYVSFGMVTRDSEGQIMAIAARRRYVRWSADYAEAAAASFVLMKAIQLGFKYIILESDAVSLVSAIKHNSGNFSPLFIFYDEIRRMKNSIEHFDVCHVNRGGNTIAHLVARWDVDPDHDFICNSSFPQSILALAELDLI